MGTICRYWRQYGSSFPCWLLGSSFIESSTTLQMFFPTTVPNEIVILWQPLTTLIDLLGDPLGEPLGTSLRDLG